MEKVGALWNEGGIECRLRPAFCSAQFPGLSQDQLAEGPSAAAAVRAATAAQARAAQLVTSRDLP